MAQGRIPGKNYSISEWDERQLRTWLQQNMATLLPSSLQTRDSRLDTLRVGTSLTLSTAAIADLKTQLGI